MNIAPASISDLAEVSSWIATEHECRNWAGPAVTYPISMARLLDQISFSSESSFSYKSELELVGFGQIIQKEHGRSHLARIISSPVYRGNGLGRKICSDLIERAYENGSSTVSLNVYRENAHAHRLYESLGFKELKEKSDGANVFMLKTLQAAQIRSGHTKHGLHRTR